MKRPLIIYAKINQELAKLPVEIWGEIFSRVLPFPKILRLARVSKHWEWLLYGLLEEVTQKYSPSHLSRARNVRKLLLADITRRDKHSLDEWLAVCPSSLKTLAITTYMSSYYSGDLLRPMATNLRELRLRGICALDCSVLQCFSSLTSLHLSRWRPRGGSISLNHMTGLKILELAINCIEKYFPPHQLSGLEHKLERLQYSRYATDSVGKVDYSFLSRLTRLTELNLTKEIGYTVFMPGFDIPATDTALHFRPPPSLLSLQLTNNNSVGSDLLEKMTQLTVLDIGGRSDENDAGALLLLPQLTKLNFTKHTCVNHVFVAESLSEGHWPGMKLILNK
jgi:hypothetical protein